MKFSTINKASIKLCLFSNISVECGARSSCANAYCYRLISAILLQLTIVANPIEVVILLYILNKRSIIELCSLLLFIAFFTVVRIK
uniref:Uncharacterized protein n=1 Tax=Parascaris equorum TaxID=6256 RepID=A0A914RSC3_PAREQ